MNNRQHSSFSSILIALSLATVTAFAGCQTYTEGLKQDVAYANELSALATLHAIALAQQTYSVSNGGKYGTLEQLTDGGFLEPTSVGGPEKKDYVFKVQVGQKSGLEFYSCNADPRDKPGRHFYIDSTSRDVHVNPTQPATETDPPKQP